MGHRTPPVHPTREDAPIVAFDFDGTLTVKDSYQDFLKWRSGALSYAVGMARLTPALLAYAAHPDRQALKEAVTREFLGGAPLTRVVEEAARYHKASAARLLRPDALARWEAWRGEGARMVIVSATPETVLGPFARALHAERLIATVLETDARGAVTGRFIGPNCRGPEKVRRLREAFGENVRLAAAYGDSDGDNEMLDLAEERGLKVFTAKP